MPATAVSHLDPATLDRLAALFRVLGESARLELLQEIKQGEKSVSELVDATGQGQANVSKHLKTLRQSGLVIRRREGTKVFYKVGTERVFELCRIVCECLDKPAPDAAMPGSVLDSGEPA